MHRQRTRKPRKHTVKIGCLVAMRGGTFEPVDIVRVHKTVFVAADGRRFHRRPKQRNHGQSFGSEDRLTPSSLMRLERASNA